MAGWEGGTARRTMKPQKSTRSVASTDVRSLGKAHVYVRSYLDHSEFLAFARVYETFHAQRLREVFELLGPDSAGKVQLANMPEAMEEVL